MSILTRVQANPEISTNNGAYVTELIARAKQFIVEYCQLLVYPSLSQGYSKSKVTPGTDFQALTTNALMVSLNGDTFQEVEPTLANMDTGDNAAAELQTVIRALDDDDGYSEVTVVYDSSSGAEYYTFTAGRYGEGSSFNILFEEENKHVAQTGKLTPAYGGTEVVGGKQDDELDNACVMLIEQLYNKASMEGMKSASMLGGLSFTEHDLDPRVASTLQARRRLWM